MVILGDDRIKTNPRGEGNYDATIDRLTDLLGLDWWTTSDIYSYAASCLQLSPDNYGVIAAGLRNRFSLSGSNIYEVCKTLYTNYMNQEYDVELSEGEMQKRLDQVFGFFNNVTPNTYGRFGWDATHPIMVGGLQLSNRKMSKSVMTNTYLASLVTENDLDLEWKRVGSVCVDNICRPIEVFKIKEVAGKELGLLYVCEYGLASSGHCPEGFKFRKGFRNLKGKKDESKYSKFFKRILRRDH